jgi:3-oxoacyl-[acyl-carrier-protein] synthase I
MCARAGRLQVGSCHLLDKRGRDVGIGRVAGIGGAVHGRSRLLALGAPALREAFAKAGVAGPILLALPDRRRPDADDDDDLRFLADLSTASGVAFDLPRSKIFRTGHAGGAAAFADALCLLRDRVVSNAVVGGIDSYYHPDALAWLDQACRLHTLETENGFIPGEAAAFVVLGDASSSADRGLPVELVHAAIARETADPSLGAAMTTILREMKAAAGRTIGWVLSDVSVEAHRIAEWQLAAGRGSLACDAVHSRLVDALGELGAATGPVLAAIASTWWAAGCAPQDRAVVALHSDGEERGAVLLRRREPARAAAPRAGVGVPRAYRLDEHTASLAGAPATSRTAPCLEALARECIEDVGAMGLLRIRRPAETWSTAIGGFEQRLLDNVDALFALAERHESSSTEQNDCHALDLLALVHRYADDAFAPDPARAFAGTFVACCVDGTSSVEDAVAALRRAPVETYPAHRDALVLAPNPAVSPAMHELCTDESAQLIRLALQVMARRGEGDHARALALLGHRHAGVREAAARCLAVSAVEGAAAGLESALVREPDEAAGLAIAQALVQQHAARGLAFVRARLSADGALSARWRGAYLRTLALGGDASDRRLLSHALRSGLAGVISAGWYGHPAMVDELVALLDGGASGDMAAAASHSLRRIVGDPSPVVAAPADPTRVVDPDQWREYWWKRRSESGAADKLRFGAPYTPRATIAELSRPSMLTLDRASCALELGFGLGPTCPFRVHDWLSNQMACLAALDAALDSECRVSGRSP